MFPLSTITALSNNHSIVKGRSGKGISRHGVCRTPEFMQASNRTNFVYCAGRRSGMDAEKGMDGVQLTSEAL